jgi:hypothetical protein
MRTITAVLFAATLVSSQAFAAAGSVTPLASGKPAGVKEAAVLGPNGTFIFLGLAIVAGGLALTLGGKKDGITSPTTSGIVTGIP